MKKDFFLSSSLKELHLLLYLPHKHTNFLPERMHVSFTAKTPLPASLDSHYCHHSGASRFYVATALSQSRVEVRSSQVHLLPQRDGEAGLTLCPVHCTATMTDLAKRVAALGPMIEQLMSIGGTAGLSLVILHQGKPIYYANYGFRDREKNLPVTEETIFPGCSLTKALTSATLALLVEEEKVAWDTLVKHVLPDFEIKDDILRNCTTIADLLCHRTGMSWGDNLYVGTDNNILISGKDSLK